MATENKSPRGLSASFGPYTFERYGRANHLKIQDLADLAKVLELDEAHWVATNAPIATINADPVFLAGIDVVHDGRIQAAEVKQAIRWFLDQIQDARKINLGSTRLNLAAVPDNTDDGQRIHEAASKILSQTHAADLASISLEAVRAIKKKAQEGGLDTSGMVLPNAASNPRVRQLIEDILATVGGEPHPNGGKGLTLDRLEQFLNEGQIFLDWLRQAELPPGQTSSPIMPLGPDTLPAYELFSFLRDKIDQYFALCDLVRLDPLMADHVRPRPAQFEQLDFANTKALESFLADLPLAWPRPEGQLLWEALLNPFYARQLEQFLRQILGPILGSFPKAFSADQWAQVKDRFATHRAWSDARPQLSVGTLSNARLRADLMDAGALQTVRALIHESRQTALDLDNLRLLEMLILYQAYLLLFVNSFVSFPDLYDPTRRALFERGTLIMDGRHFTLSVKVLDRAQHAKFSNASNMFVLYVEVSEREGQKLYEVAVPVTAGSQGNLQVGKWGIFKDVWGRELHAQVVQIVANPISLSEAIAAPFKRLGNTISEKLGERAAQAEAKLHAISTEPAIPLPLASPKPAPKPPALTDGRAAGQLLAGGGIAVAALGSSIAFITKTLGELSLQQLAGGVLATLLAVMLPVTVMAWIKLSKRDLSSILEGSGWAINARMRLTHRLAHNFTRKPPYPPGTVGVVAAGPSLSAPSQSSHL